MFGSADTSSRLKRIKQLEEKLVAPDGSITIDKDTDLSVIEDEKVRKMVAAIQAEAERRRCDLSSQRRFCLGKKL